MSDSLTPITATYTPDRLLAGVYPVITDTLLTGLAGTIVRGNVLGQITLGAGSVLNNGAGTAGANTGNGTLVLATEPKLPFCVAGDYVVRITAAGTNSFTARVTSPRGNVLGDISVASSGGSVRFANQIDFTITDGSTDFAVGDGFIVRIAAGSNRVRLHTAAAVDGSQVPYCIAAGPSTGNAARVQVYLAGQFNQSALVFGAGATVDTVRDPLRAVGIFIQSSTPA